MEQWVQKSRGTVGTEDQRNSGHRGPDEQWAQRTRGTVGTEEQWAQRTRGTVGTEDQWNSGYIEVHLSAVSIQVFK